jgi:hypothetical protein
MGISTVINLLPSKCVWLATVLTLSLGVVSMSLAAEERPQVFPPLQIFKDIVRMQDGQDAGWSLEDVAKLRSPDDGGAAMAFFPVRLRHPGRISVHM